MINMTRDITDRFDSAKTNTLLRASKLAPLGTGVTIGPQANLENGYFIQDDYSYFEEDQELPISPKLQCDEEPELVASPSPITASIALQELEELRKADVKDSVNKYVEQITFFEQQLKNKMNEELNSLVDEMKTKSKLKEKLTESRITDDDLPMSKIISELISKCQLEKQITEKEKIEEGKKLQVQKEEESRLKVARIQIIQNIFLEYRKVYEGVIDIMKQCKNNQKLLSRMYANINELRVLSGALNSIVEKMKIPNIEEKDIEVGQMILQRAIQISTKIKEVTEEINKEQEIENEKQKQITAPPEPSKTAKVAESVPKASQDSDERNILDKCVCKENYEIYQKYLKIFNEVAKQVQSVPKTKNTVPFIMFLKISINTPINAMVSFNADYMRDKYSEIVRLLRGNFKYSTTNIDPQMRQLYYPICIDFLCKKFISKGEDLILTKSEDAFSLASLILAVWIEFPDFGELLLAYFMSKCPYIIPAYWPQFKDQTDKDYYTSLGYRFSDEDVIEDHNHFLKRMTGIIMLYAAIVVIEPRHYKPHPHGMQYAWRWIAAILNLEPSLDITATLIYAFLNIAGFKLSQIYGSQFWKLVHFLYTEYYPKIDKVTPNDFRGPLNRLKEFLENVLKMRKFPVPNGVISPTFW